MLSRWIIGGVALAIVCGCGYQLDTTRHPAERGTLGQEILRILAKDLVRSEPEKGAALQREEQRFVRGFDALMPEPLHDAVQAYLEALLPLYDQGRVQGVVRPTACLLGEIARDAEALNATWYLRRPGEGYGQSGCLLPLIRRLAVHPGLPDLLSHLSSLWLSRDGLDAALTPSAEDDTFQALLRDLVRWLSDREIEAPDPNAGRPGKDDFLLGEDARLLDPALPEQQVVLTDYRGRALVTPDPGTQQIPAPFVDLDQDGLADADPLTGDFIDGAGAALSVPPPFASDGSRPVQNGHLIYRYSDLRQVRLSALAAQLPPLISDGFLWDLPDALPALLGPLGARADADGTYPGYDPDSSPAVAVLHAVRAVANYPRLPAALETLQTAAERAEPQVARLLGELDRVGDILDRYADVSLADHNRLLDDLVPLLRESAGRGYLLGLLEAFSDSRTHALRGGLADMIRYRDRLGYTSEDAQDNASSFITPFQDPTDFSAPDTVYGNRSNFQRVTHLIYDTRGAGYQAYIDLFGWFVIPDLLNFYADSTAGQASVPGWISPFIAQFSSSNPSTEEVNRFIVDDHSVLGNPTGNEGQELRFYNGEALLALQKSGMLAALRPAFAAFVLRDRGAARPGTQVLADLLAALHPHYSPNVSGASSACAHIRRLEPMLLQILDSTEVLDAAIELFDVLGPMTTASGLQVLPEIDALVRFLLEPDPSITRHDGATSVAGGDGLTPITPISPLYLLKDAFRMVDDAVAADPAADAALTRAWDLLYDRFLTVEDVGGIKRLKNRAAWTLLLDALLYLSQRAQARIDSGTLTARLDEFEQDFRDVVGGRVLPRLLTAWRTIAADPVLPGELDALLLDLLDGSTPERLAEHRRILAWALQHLAVERVVVPWEHRLAAILDPDQGRWEIVPAVGCTKGDPPFSYLSQLFDLLGPLITTEGAGQPVLGELVKNAGTLDPAAAGAWPLDDLLSVLSAVHRLAPQNQDPLAAGDLASILGQVRDYLLDGTRGLEKLYVMIDRRDGFD